MNEVDDDNATLDANFNAGQGQVPYSQPPVGCQLDRSRKMFRITHSRGKTIAAGVFGVIIAVEEKKNPEHFLFLEEVLYLYERGLIVVHDEDERKIDRYGLYNLMESCGLERGVYHVYAYLRAQMYKVVRHTAQRAQILRNFLACELQSNQRNAIPADCSSVQEKEDHLTRVGKVTLSKDKDFGSSLPTASHEGLKEGKDVLINEHKVEQDGKKKEETRVSPLHFSWLRELRKDAANASNHRISECGIAFDVYQPTCQNIRKRLPDFYVSIHEYSRHEYWWNNVQSLLNECAGLPLKMAAVSEVGAVNMFGITGLGVPNINARS